MLVYTTQDPQEGYIPDGNLKISSLKTGVADTTTLWPQNSEIIESLAWSPDGQSLAISLPRNEKHPLRIDQITLKGEHSNLLTLGEAGIKENESYNHEVIKEALDYAVELELIRDNPADQVNPITGEVRILFTDFLLEWLEMTKHNVEMTTKEVLWGC